MLLLDFWLKISLRLEDSDSMNKILSSLFCKSLQVVVRSHYLLVRLPNHGSLSHLGFRLGQARRVYGFHINIERVDVSVSLQHNKKTLGTGAQKFQPGNTRAVKLQLLYYTILTKSLLKVPTCTPLGRTSRFSKNLHITTCVMWLGVVVASTR